MILLLAAAQATQWTMRLQKDQRVATIQLPDAGAYGPRCVPPPADGSRRRFKRLCAPSFLIIGFGRCGTTSLARYLNRHPRASFGTRKEHFSFYRPEFCDLQHGPNNGSACDVSAYASQFPVARKEPQRDATFDATPMLGGDMGVPASERTMAWLATRLPGLRFLVLVKSPADRFMSNPLASNKVARFQDSLEAGTNAMPRKLRQLLLDNCYVDKLEAWLKFFPPERFLLLQSEDLRVETRRQAMLDEVHDFLRLPPHAYPAEDLAELGNFRKFTNTTVSPALRSTVNCLPALAACEARLRAANFPRPLRYPLVSADVWTSDRLSESSVEPPRPGAPPRRDRAGRRAARLVRGVARRRPGRARALAVQAARRGPDAPPGAAARRRGRGRYAYGLTLRAAARSPPRPAPRCFPRRVGDRGHVERYCAPSFLIIGFGRCGTTSLAKYLAAHPRCGFGTRKEHFDFSRPENCDLHHGPNNSSRCDLEEYARTFPIVASTPASADGRAVRRRECCSYVESPRRAP
ncbi:FK506 binding protein [Aureococcus anophagefferens]|nr:FK506 binding protein [Aureococcus anophagefferens]